MLAADRARVALSDTETCIMTDSSAVDEPCRLDVAPQYGERYPRGIDGSHNVDNTSRCRCVAARSGHGCSSFTDRVDPPDRRVQLSSLAGCRVHVRSPAGESLGGVTSTPCGPAVSCWPEPTLVTR